MPADSLSEEPLKVRKVDLRHILANLLKVESRYVAKKLTYRFDHIASTKRGSGLIKPCPQPPYGAGGADTAWDASGACGAERLAVRASQNFSSIPGNWIRSTVPNGSLAGFRLC